VTGAAREREVIDFLLPLALVLTCQSGKAPCTAMLLLCSITWCTLPSPYAEGVTGVLLVVGGIAARRQMARRMES
jgi:hypothetical protein